MPGRELRRNPQLRDALDSTVALQTGGALIWFEDQDWQPD
jgi:hypothetical protein